MWRVFDLATLSEARGRAQRCPRTGYNVADPCQESIFVAQNGSEHFVCPLEPFSKSVCLLAVCTQAYLGTQVSPLAFKTQNQTKMFPPQVCLWNAQVPEKNQSYSKFLWAISSVQSTWTHLEHFVHSRRTGCLTISSPIHTVKQEPMVCSYPRVQEGNTQELTCIQCPRLVRHCTN